MSDEALKTNVEVKLDDKFKPLMVNTESKTSLLCNRISSFLTLTLFIYILETFIFEVKVDRDMSQETNVVSVSNVSEEAAVDFGVHVMVDSLYIALCLTLIHYFVKLTYHLIYDNFCISNENVENAPSVQIVGVKDQSSSFDIESEIDTKSAPLLSSLETSSSNETSSSSDTSSLSDYMPPPSTYSFKQGFKYGKVQEF